MEGGKEEEYRGHLGRRKYRGHKQWKTGEGVNHEGT